MDDAATATAVNVSVKFNPLWCAVEVCGWTVACVATLTNVRLFQHPPTVTGWPFCKWEASCRTWAWTAPAMTVSSLRRCVEPCPAVPLSSVELEWLLWSIKSVTTEDWTTWTLLWGWMGLSTSFIHSKWFWQTHRSVQTLVLFFAQKRLRCNCNECAMCFVCLGSY